MNYLIESLEINRNFKIIFVGAPKDYVKALQPSLPDRVTIYKKLSRNLDVIQYFTTNKLELEQRFEKLKESMSLNGILWISWPKNTSKLNTDLDEKIVKNIAESFSLIANEVISVNDDWSAIKLMYGIKG